VTVTRTCPGYGCGAALRDGYLCRSCQRRAERVLGDLPSLAREVETTIARQDRGATGRAGDGAEQPLPVNLSAGDRARHPDVLPLLFEWADHVAACYRVQGLPVFAAALPMTVTVPRAVAVLLRYSDWMRLSEQGPELANALSCVRRDLRKIIDRHLGRTYAGPCRAKTTVVIASNHELESRYRIELTRQIRCPLALYRYWGSDEIICDGHLDPEGREGCGTVHPAAERAEFLVDQVRQQLLPLKLVWESLYVLLPGCQVDWATAQRWTRPQRVRDDTGSRVRIRVVAPRLEPAEWAGDTPLYRGSDILRLAEDKAPRRGRRRHVRTADVSA
jgi:hypothetical protein